MTRTTAGPAKTRKPSSNQPFNLTAYLERGRRWVDRALDKKLPSAKRFPETLHAAMRHSLFSGGKRLRPVLVLAAAEACGGEASAVLPAACALECVHTYSLIHDDLPAMDNDDWRRGRPTCHKAFGEATAILAGDALLTFAFELMAQPPASTRRVKPAAMTDAIAILARSAGMAGMVGGQMADMAAEGKPVDLPMLQYIHTHKTGRLLQGALLIGATLAGGLAAQRRALSIYGETLGLAFQIMDDVLNVVGEKRRLGKQTGTDAARGKATYPALFGVEESRRQASALLDRGLRALKIFGPSAEPLRALAHYIVDREV